MHDGLLNLVHAGSFDRHAVRERIALDAKRVDSLSQCLGRTVVARADIFMRQARLLLNYRVDGAA